MEVERLLCFANGWTDWASIYLCSPDGFSQIECSSAEGTVYGIVRYLRRNGRHRRIWIEQQFVGSTLVETMPSNERICARVCVPDALKEAHYVIVTTQWLESLPEGCFLPVAAIQDSVVFDGLCSANSTLEERKKETGGECSFALNAVPDLWSWWSQVTEYTHKGKYLIECWSEDGQPVTGRIRYLKWREPNRNIFEDRWFQESIIIHAIEGDVPISACVTSAGWCICHVRATLLPRKARKTEIKGAGEKPYDDSAASEDADKRIGRLIEQGIEYFLLGEMEEAERCLEESWSLGVDSPVLSQMAFEAYWYLLMRMGKQEELTLLQKQIPELKSKWQMWRALLPDRRWSFRYADGRAFYLAELNKYDPRYLGGMSREWNILGSVILALKELKELYIRYSEFGNELALLHIRLLAEDLMAPGTVSLPFERTELILEPLEPEENHRKRPGSKRPSAENWQESLCSRLQQGWALRKTRVGPILLKVTLEPDGICVFREALLNEFSGSIVAELALETFAERLRGWLQELCQSVRADCPTGSAAGEAPLEVEFILTDGLVDDPESREREINIFYGPGCPAI